MDTSTFFSGHEQTTVSGTKIPAMKPLGQGTLKSCSGHVRKAAPGAIVRAGELPGADT